MDNMKPSELLLAAVDDLRLLSGSPDYVVNMNIWHTPLGGVCHICLAGAIIAKRLNVPHSIVSSPSYFPAIIWLKLLWINSVCEFLSVHHLDNLPAIVSFATWLSTTSYDYWPEIEGYLVFAKYQTSKYLEA